MCLAIPVQITAIDDQQMATVTLGGVERRISLVMTPEAQIGDYVLVHTGYAISVLDPDEAQVSASADVGADAIELHTGAYANAKGDHVVGELDRLYAAAMQAENLGLELHAGHGLTVRNLAPVAALPGEQVLQDVVQGFAGNPGRKRLPRRLVRFHVSPREERVIVKHLFKMGNQPVSICGVTRKAAACLIVNSSGSHIVEG